MLFQAVYTAATVFSVFKNCTVQGYPLNSLRLDITPRNSRTEIIIEPDIVVPGCWEVRILTDYSRRFGLPPLHLPPVSTPEGLKRTLERAWALEEQRNRALRRGFTRLRDPSGPEASTPPESASRPFPQRGG